MNTIMSLCKFLNITDSYRDSCYYYSLNIDKGKDKPSQYYPAINVHARKDNNKSDSEYRYDDNLYNYQLIQREMLGDKPIIFDRKSNNTKTNISKTNISNYATCMKTPYEIHGDKVLINAQYYTFWISIDAFNQLKS